MYAPSYRHVAWVYDALASAYSLGAIDRAKRIHLDQVQANDRVLYAGAGRGREIASACERGASVTCVEPCPAMAIRLRKRLNAFSTQVRFETRPIQAIPAEPVYDLVVAHFFLNVFDAAAMAQVLNHLCTLIRPGGRLVIADFRPTPQDAGLIKHAMSSLYYRPLNLIGRLLGICSLHPIYDYAPLLKQNRFTVTSRRPQRPIGLLPAFYEVTIASRASTHPVLNARKKCNP